MANHPSAEKRNRQRIRRTERNKAVRSTVRTTIKKVRSALASGDAKQASELVRTANSELARAARKGVMHRRTASRATSRLHAAVSKLGT